MNTRPTRDYLLRLHDLILQERECAKAMDIKGMVEAMNNKDQLITLLANIKDIAEEDKPLAAEIRAENRRNAFLFKSTLGWIRETMEFFGQKSVTSTYSKSAYTVAAQVNGRLLSGRV